MKNFIESVIRTPGMLFMSILITGFIINAGVQYINSTGFEGPNLLAAGCLLVGQFIVAVVHQMRRFAQDNTLNLQ
ncbi:MAG: hypothetical protein RLO04_12800 [Limnobacter sp.]|uniref:hypothetical protein n=1 Tax=Limnobacter sp. TaxID=2003368 RepID=UPI0032EAC011